MIIKKEDLRKYLLPNCCIESVNGWQYYVKDIGGNFATTTNNTTIEFKSIKSIKSYRIPYDIETNGNCIGSYVKLDIRTDKHDGFWLHNEWARIIAVNQSTYALRIKYLNRLTDAKEDTTIVGKEEIGLYNPFCCEPIIVEESVISDISGTMVLDPIKKPMLQYNQIKKIADEMMITLNDKDGAAAIDFFKTFASQSSLKQKLNFDVLLNEQKITLDQYN